MRTDSEIREWFSHLRGLEWTMDENTVEHFISWLHLRDEKCLRCDGKGKLPIFEGGEFLKCPDCDGSGFLSGPAKKAPGDFSRNDHSKCVFYEKLEGGGWTCNDDNGCHFTPRSEPVKKSLDGKDPREVCPDRCPLKGVVLNTKIMCSPEQCKAILCPPSDDRCLKCNGEKVILITDDAGGCARMACPECHGTGKKPASCKGCDKAFNDPDCCADCPPGQGKKVE